MAFSKCTDMGNDPVYINLDRVQEMQRIESANPAYTLVGFAGGARRDVKETPQEIINASR